MLTSAPTKFGTGITLYGDFLDLETVHRTIHKIASDGTAEERMANFMLALAYDIRKAKENRRETRKLGVTKEESAKYKGVAVLWPFFLVQVALLRHHAGYRDTNQRDQACLYLLEDCAITSLLAYDRQVGAECVELFLNFPTLPNDYLFEFCSDRAKHFVTLPVGSRFQALPRLLRSIWWLSPEYNTFAGELKEQAEKHGCSPHELQDRSDWPDFKW
jgi:hypothetical protein